jgi:protein-tyrosine sulfotransferase
MTPPIFILSNFRSGSTLLRYALDSHPSICCPAELRLAAFSHHVFKVVELTSADAADPAQDRMADRISAVRDAVGRIMQAYCQRKGKIRWCDKSPSNVEALCVLASVFPDAQYVCLHRHPLDQVYSTLDIDGLNRLQSYLARHRGDAVSAAIDRWCTVTEGLLAFEHEFHGRVRRMAYERLVQNPDDELTRLMQFLHVEVVPGLAEAAFAQPHDRGPSDMKIGGASRVESDRIGKGRALDLSRVSPDLLQRLGHVREVLGYS